LVLGLAEGGDVTGAAYRVLEPDWNETYEYLREREQPTETYVEDRATVTLDDGRAIDALIFLSDKTHPQWAGVLELSVQAQMIAEASGLSGRNVDYLRDLVGHLRLEEAGDEAMETLLAEVESLQGRATSFLKG
jgi:cation transport protein ChaC